MIEILFRDDVNEVVPLPTRQRIVNDVGGDDRFTDARRNTTSDGRSKTVAVRRVVYASQARSALLEDGCV